MKDLFYKTLSDQNCKGESHLTKISGIKLKKFDACMAVRNGYYLLSEKRTAWLKVVVAVSTIYNLKL